ncbi:DUF983 domain-containing protein [Runella slithyformis]|uniref:DUF983 domain-containing protein n=1 Tax=Runella slithyformis (strain ATCC 29530 / DSM 19594 / LMG 11500 / NCIMB 11436 / LSU 4) TaxID=761193 RepID=A0A7U3ZMU9_RUNSL|nr:DUF983 domain-containing protein [Runella slithyformis]AEI50137.1 hypothetical protein Runsl_3779 [Runella slithyformis DSM 19594]
MRKGSKIYSILYNKCPRCQQGAFFVYNNPFNLRKFDKMHPHCEVCGESFEREPGFYFGGMYGSYTLYTLLIASVFVSCVVVLKINIFYVLAFLIPILIISQPVFFRWGRLLWINIFVSYNPDAANGEKKITPKW